LHVRILVQLADEICHAGLELLCKFVFGRDGVFGRAIFCI
jgi:hypothetical protein